MGAIQGAVPGPHMVRKNKEIPSTQGLDELALNVIRRSGKTGITPQQIALQLGLKGKPDREDLHRALADLQTNGRVRIGNKGRYLAERSTTLLEGSIDVTTSGNAYVVLGDGTPDVYIHARDTGMALHGDRVQIKSAPGRSGKPEGKVLAVVERRRSRFVGKLHTHHGRLVLIPDDHKVQRPFLIVPGDGPEARDGDKVEVELSEWKDGRDLPRAHVVRNLGRAGVHEVEIHAILAEFGLPTEFPERVLADAAKVKDGVTPEEIAKRRDIRNITTLTIDPEDAKDLDDALSIRGLPNGYFEVGIHIADVSHYVRPGSALDEEAAQRATSVYLVDRVVPMLPERISNDLCSLNPDSDKLSFSAILELDAKGAIHGEWFGRTVMRSNRRLAYADAQAIIDGADKGKDAYQEEVLQLHRIAEQLRSQRMSDGALEIGGNEVKFRLDAQGRPVEVYEKVMGSANWLIEEFMLLANRRVATYVSDLRRKTGRDHPFVYRVHDTPDPEKVEQLRTLVKSFGHSLDIHKGEELPHAINRLLRTIQGTDEENIIKQVAIRSMAKAIYSTDNVGHYGLAFKHYTHFTSPIRRYPDLLVHRGLQHYLDQGKPLNKEALDLSCKHSSTMEKRASDAERASIRFKQAEYMKERIGQRFAGTVSGVTGWGVYVTLTENKCEGMVPLRDIPGDHYRFDQDRFMVQGSRTGRTIRLGDDVEVIVREVDMEKRTVDLAFTALADRENDTYARPDEGWDETRPTRAGAPPRNSKKPRNGFRQPKGSGAKKGRKKR